PARSAFRGRHGIPNRHPRRVSKIHRRHHKRQARHSTHAAHTPFSVIPYIRWLQNRHRLPIHQIRRAFHHVSQIESSLHQRKCQPQIFPPVERHKSRSRHRVPARDRISIQRVL